MSFLTRVSNQAAFASAATSALRTLAAKSVFNVPTTTGAVVSSHGANCACPVHHFQQQKVGFASTFLNAPHPEYHRHSTRYHDTNREVLKRLEDITYVHVPPKTISDRAAFRLVKFLRKASDAYFKDRLIQRACMLETIAAVPGFVGSAFHHMRSLRSLLHCQWIKSLSDEAENERLHLMTFMEVHKPTFAQRMLILVSQGAFLAAYSLFYFLFPRTCHRFVGYLEEEAVHTYSLLLKYIDEGKIANVPAPAIAKSYWNMPKDATLRDVVLVVRADEADHLLLNHDFSNHYDHPEDGLPCSKLRVDLESPFNQQSFPEKKPNASNAAISN